MITMTYVKSKGNLADPLAKGLSKDKVKKTIAKIGLKPIVVKSWESNLILVEH